MKHLHLHHSFDIPFLALQYFKRVTGNKITILSMVGISVFSKCKVPPFHKKLDLDCIAKFKSG